MQNCILDLTNVQGAITMHTPLPSIVVSQVQGHLCKAFADAWIEATRPFLASGQEFRVFNDWGRMEGYDSASRRKLTDWTMQHRDQLRGTYFTITSSIVAMGVAVAGTTLSPASVKLETFSRGEFLTLLEDALGQGR